jgi:hypothetical protein
MCKETKKEKLCDMNYYIISRLSLSTPLVALTPNLATLAVGIM